MHKTNLELATEIVIAMINTGRINKNDSNKTDNESITNALETVFDKLEELHNKSKDDNPTYAF